MFRSLYSGVSGLAANITALDVIGNNIANSNTIGFKAGRVTFSEMLTQTLRAASRPVSGGLGGTNPQQVGLGTQVASIDTYFGQGNFQTTGMKTDLAIQGSGFFVLSDGVENIYTRAGTFGLDAASYLVDPATGLKVQGVMADENGVIMPGSFGDIFIDPGMVVPAEASTNLQMVGNLDSDSDAAETILTSLSFLAAATGGDLLTTMSGQGGGSLGLNTGDVIVLSGRVGGTDLIPSGVDSTFTVGAGTTYQDVVAWINNLVTGQGHNLNFAIQSDGSLQVTNNAGQAVDGLSLSSAGHAVFNQNFLWPSSIASGTSATTADGPAEHGALRAYAEAGDALASLYSSSGASLGLDLSSGSTTIDINGSVGGDSVPPATMTVTAATTLDDLMREIQYALSINSNPVVVNEQGQIVVRGEVGTASALGEISVTEPGNDAAMIESAFNFNQTQQASDQQTFSLATTAYDSLGGEHTITVSFEKVAGLNEWIWTASADGGEEILSGGSGRIRFGSDGTVSSFTYDDGAGALSFRPQPTGDEGADLVVLDLDYGEIGGLTGLTQFAGRGTLHAIADGFQAGHLVDFAIDQSGMITGYFSNDTLRDIAQIGLAQFSNPEGLMREANNTYRLSGNSGEAMNIFAGEGNNVAMVAGALEASNVDLALEFTRLVVAQRAFQANARVVSTGDEIMQELVNLIR